MFERAKIGYKPPKPKKTRVSFFIPDDLLVKFEKYCEDNHYKRNELVECILEEFIMKYGLKKKR